jgi:hypothetical protein
MDDDIDMNTIPYIYPLILIGKSRYLSYLLHPHQVEA